MAIESLYWKEELARIAKSIRPVTKPKRWSERAVCVVERDVMIGCFIVRRMIELHKTSSRVTELKLDVFSTPVVKPVTKMSRFSIEENYDWKAEKEVKKAVLYVCNQCMHAYVSFVDRASDRNWSNLLVVSDYDRNNVIWRIPFSTLIQLFETVAKDWPASYSMVYDDKLGDYRVTTD
jgi:hypothetical protein